MRTQEQTETLAERYPQSAYTINGKLHVAAEVEPGVAPMPLNATELASRNALIMDHMDRTIAAENDALDVTDATARKNANNFRACPAGAIRTEFVECLTKKELLAMASVLTGKEVAWIMVHTYQNPKQKAPRRGNLTAMLGY